MKKQIPFFSHSEKVTIQVTGQDREIFGNNPTIAVEVFDTDGELIPGDSPVKKTLDDEGRVTKVIAHTGKNNGFITIS